MSSEKERMLRGELYDPSDPELVEERRRARALTRRYNETSESDGTERDTLLTELLGSVGGDVFVEPPFRCDYGYNVHVGAGFFANFDCVFLDVCPIEIGEGCLLGPGVHVYLNQGESPALHSSCRTSELPSKLDRLEVMLPRSFT